MKRAKVVRTPTIVTSKAKGIWTSKGDRRKWVVTGSDKASLSKWLNTVKASTPAAKSLASAKVILKCDNSCRA